MLQTLFIAIVGHSGAGKTRLIERLVPDLSKRGYRVGTLKHTEHSGHTLGDEGKDSDRHFRSGSVAAMFSCAEQIQLKLRPDKTFGLQKYLPLFFRDSELVLVEGFRDSLWPDKRILVAAPNDDSADYIKRTGENRVIAVVGQESGYPAVPWFSREDYAAIAELIHSEIQAVKCQPIY